MNVKLFRITSKSDPNSGKTKRIKLRGNRIDKSTCLDILNGKAVLNAHLDRLGSFGWLLQQKINGIPFTKKCEPRSLRLSWYDKTISGRIVRLGRWQNDRGENL